METYDNLIECMDKRGLFDDTVTIVRYVRMLNKAISYDDMSIFIDMKGNLDGPRPIRRLGELVRKYNKFVKYDP